MNPNLRKAILKCIGCGAENEVWIDLYVAKCTIDKICSKCGLTFHITRELGGEWIYWQYDGEQSTIEPIEMKDLLEEDRNSLEFASECLVCHKRLGNPAYFFNAEVINNFLGIQPEKVTYWFCSPACIRKFFEDVFPGILRGGKEAGKNG